MSIIKPINYSTHKIKEVLKIDNHQLSELMSLSQHKFYALNSDYSKAPLWAMHKFSTRLGISLSNLISSHIDYETVKEHFNGNLNYIPKRYQAYKESRMKTISNVLENSTPEVKSFIKTNLQLNDSHFSDLNMKISGLALIDTFKQVKSIGKSDKDLKDFGFSCSQKYKNHLLTPSAKNSKNPKQLYEEVIENLNHIVEKNLHYVITTKSHNSILMTVSTRDELQDT